MSNERKRRKKNPKSDRKKMSQGKLDSSYGNNNIVRRASKPAKGRRTAVSGVGTGKATGSKPSTPVRYKTKPGKKKVYKMPKTRRRG